MFHNACGRFWPVFRHPFPSGPDPGAITFERSQRQYWTVGNRPIRKNDLRSLHRNSVEAQIQDRSRQKTGLNTAPGFSRVYPSFPRTREPRGKQSTPHQPPLRGAKGTRAQHAGDARNSPPPTIPADHPVIPADYPVIPASPVIPADHPVIPADHPVIPADYPVIPADAGTQSKTKHTISLPFRFAKGDASAASRGMPENHQNPHNRRSTPSHNNHPPTSPQYPLPQQRVPSPASNHPSPSQGEIKRGSRVRATGGQGARPTQTTTPPITAVPPPSNTPSFPSFPIIRIKVQNNNPLHRSPLSHNTPSFPPFPILSILVHPLTHVYIRRSGIGRGGVGGLATGL